MISGPADPRPDAQLPFGTTESRTIRTGFRPVTTDQQRPRRERVVLAERRGARMVRTRVEVQEQTEVGDTLVRGLMRAQLGLALRSG